MNRADWDTPKIGAHRLRPESLMMSYGYRPELSQGAIKSPIFQTSTFVFDSAEEGKAFFELAYGLRAKREGEELGLIYSRVNNPDMEILEDRLTLWDGAEAAAVFNSGMAAISTTLLTFLRPGDVILHSEPVYGGTDFLLKHVLAEFGVRAVGYPARGNVEALVKALDDAEVATQATMLFIETPSNPTNDLVDIPASAALIRRKARARVTPLVVVDNTFLGPLWQQPLHHGADLVVYSATKYIGGHSDLIAGVTLGNEAHLNAIKGMRTILGSATTPWISWLLLRSLETLKMRMTAQMKNARYVADYLADHPKVRRLHYLGHLDESDPTYEVYRRQCLAPGGMISFELIGGEAEAFRFLNALTLFHLAVSLGGTESLAEHPATMTHSDVDPAERMAMGITPNLVRLSVGVEHFEDLLADLEQALETV